MSGNLEGKVSSLVEGVRALQECHRLVEKLSDCSDFDEKISAFYKEKKNELHNLLKGKFNFFGSAYDSEENMAFAENLYNEKEENGDPVAAWNLAKMDQSSGDYISAINELCSAYELWESEEDKKACIDEINLMIKNESWSRKEIYQELKDNYVEIYNKITCEGNLICDNGVSLWDEQVKETMLKIFDECPEGGGFAACVVGNYYAFTLLNLNNHAVDFWFKKAIELGCADAAWNYGIIYKNKIINWFGVREKETIDKEMMMLFLKYTVEAWRLYTNDIGKDACIEQTVNVLDEIPSKNMDRIESMKFKGDIFGQLRKSDGFLIALLGKNFPLILIDILIHRGNIMKLVDNIVSARDSVREVADKFSVDCSGQIRKLDSILEKVDRELDEIVCSLKMGRGDCKKN
ncbi:MAG: hypothetical protein Harvfovirus15_17 [Harvfovirus sp.]|uniref:Uncharacterized protein n=1 Tax=Harvfovirus sp. TaxID=2487768 RepID=A0A3G5A5H3_9VIRU|nr:MAG: hypothetical protein Harvfovirus15_17 [Harvfovirus sp.]